MTAKAHAIMATTGPSITEHIAFMQSAVGSFKEFDYKMSRSRYHLEQVVISSGRTLLIQAGW